MNPSDDERLLQAMASGACLLDDDGRVVAVNARGARALGVRTAEARGLRVVLREDGPPAPEGGGAERSEALARIVTANPRMQALLAMLPGVARSVSPVLILGETGTGKELLARAIHDLSGRRAGPFVAVNCGALPDALLESELFGYRKGAFTDAVADRPGRFAAAEGGTLLLDEIGDISMPMQVKLLRVLQEKRYEPLGSTVPVEADVRIVAATHRDLDAMMREGRFRSDLYYRIHVVELHIPPLRRRPEDIPLLVRHFIARANDRSGKVVRSIAPEAMRLLERHPFPGNIRELENLVERAHVLCPHDEIQAACLPASVTAAAPGAAPRPQADGDESASCCGHYNFDRRTGTMTDGQERDLLVQALQRFAGHRKRTAQAMGIDPSTLWRKMKKYGLLEPGAAGR
ncbi:MAG: sigma 54-interacting transcriptional regulator [Planctomycetes bacterium]|nr:sigma 54-interacting transcriptional regulator [Planctomycetota bacterium]